MADLLKDEDFNNAVAALLEQSGSGTYQDSSDRKYRKEKDLRKTMEQTEEDTEYYGHNDPDRGRIAPMTGEINLADSGNRGLQAQFSGSQIDTLFNTVFSPASSGTRKTNALAALSSTPEWQAAVGDIAKDIIPNRDAAIKRSIDTHNAVAQANGEVIQLAKTSGQLEAQRIQEDAAQKQRVAADVAGYVARKGLDTEDYNSIVNQQAVENVNLYYKMRETQDAIAEKTAVNFLDDPATWLLNQFTVGDDVAEFNKAASRYNLNNKFIDESAAQIIAVRNANAGKIAANSAREVEIMATQALVKAEEDAVKARIQTLVSQGASEKEIQKIQDDAAQRILTIEQRDTVNENKERDREFRKAQAEEASLARREREERLKDASLTRQQRAKIQEELDAIRLREKKAKEKADEDVARAMRLVGRPDITTEEEWNKQPAAFKAATQAVKSSGGELLSDDIPGIVKHAKYIQAGLRSTDEKIRAETKAEYPPQQIKLLQSILSFAEQAKEQVETQAKKTGKTLKEKELDAEVNALVVANYKRMAAEPEKYTVSINGEPTNYYAAPPLKTLAANPSMSGNKVARAVDEFSKANPGIKEITSIQALGLLVNTMEKKRDSALPPENISNVAKDINTFYRSVADANNRDMKFSKYSLPDQTSYPLIYKGKSYDLTKPEQTHQILLAIYGQRIARAWLPKAPLPANLQRDLSQATETQE